MAREPTSRDGDMQRPSRRLVVCADDYALTPGVSRAIRELIAAGRISATSVMAASEFWPGEAPALRAIAGRASIGLHITLTDQKPLRVMPQYAPEGSFPGFGAAIRAGMMRRLPEGEVRAEIERQLESFIHHYGAPPTHIDGHHHIHQLPGIREIVVGTARGLGTPVWLRVSRDSPSAVIRRGIATPKALMIGSLGRAVERLACAAGIPTNRGFTGVYDVIGETRPFRSMVPAMLRHVGDQCLFMCHPGYPDAQLAARDAMTMTREAEHRYFMSDDWPRLLAAQSLELAPIITSR